MAQHCIKVSILMLTSWCVTKEHHPLPLNPLHWSIQMNCHLQCRLWHLNLMITLSYPLQPSHHENTRVSMQSTKPLLQSGKPYSPCYYLNMPISWHQDLWFQQVYQMTTIQQLVWLLAANNVLPSWRFSVSIEHVSHKIKQSIFTVLILLTSRCFLHWTLCLQVLPGCVTAPSLWAVPLHACSALSCCLTGRVTLHFKMVSNWHT